ncbi:hypothetical protein BDV34DRAFT_77046 [Aspergillus parasiticus]|uniref:Uncharacterized protein n=1 Tax=Aspergillus parasiticus TaxID=5067 RepID=A0A5N6DQA0_ASPPA|nr:hypothetical protein BDV34DRAFT_77046 [Aspergillus parasiticus]
MSSIANAAYERRLAQGLESVREEAMDESELQLVHLLDKHWAGVTAKYFCSTEDGRLGWIPGLAHPGNLICVFDGTTVPYVLRPRAKGYEGVFSFAYWRRLLARYLLSRSSEDERTEYMLVGECYIHGIMGSQGFGTKVFCHILGV